MKIFIKISALFALFILSDVIAKFLPFPFPGSILAMIILFFLLVSKAIKAKSLEPVSGFLLKNMPLLFIPSTVSIISYLDILKNVLWEFLAVCVISTIVTFTLTAYSVKLTVFLMHKRKEKNKNA